MRPARVGTRSIEAGPAGPNTATRSWSRPGLTIDDVARLDLGLERSALRAVVTTSEATLARDRHPPAPPDARRGRARRAGRPDRRVARRGAGHRCPDRRRRLQRGARRARYRSDARPRLPIRLCRGEWRRARASPGRPDSRRPPWTPTVRRAASTTSGSVAGSASHRRGSPSTGPPSATRRSTRATTSGSRPSSRSVRSTGPRTDSTRADAPARPPRRLASRDGEHDRRVPGGARGSRLRWPGVRCPAFP